MCEPRSPTPDLATKTLSNRHDPNPPVQAGQRKPQRRLATPALGVLASIMALVVFAEVVPDPVLLIRPSTNNQVQLTISNGVSFANYEIYGWQTLDLLLADTPVYWYTNGTSGQTNFFLDQGVSTLGFFRASSNTNWDGDAYPNWIDADPRNAAVGILAITIDSPANGSTIQ